MREWLDRPICGDLTPSALFLEARRKLHLTPMFGLMRELKRRGINLGSLHALEMFGGTGRLHTIDYAPYVASLEVWEIASALSPVLYKNLPNATVKIVDAFAQLDLTKNRFDLVLIDSSYETFNGHFEHFELFPGVFKILNNFAILVLTVSLELAIFSHYSDKHLKKRQHFYHVEDPKMISFEQMIKVYESLSTQNHFEIKWWFARNRIFMYPLRKHDRIYYLVLALQKNSTNK
jgi:hypothetical protein